MIRIAMLAAVLWWVSGCSGTSVKSEWMNPGYRGHGVRSVVVLCLPVDSKEKECEDEFVRQLARADVSAIPGYSTSTASTSKESVMRKAKDKGISRVLVSRFMKTKEKWEPVWPESTNIQGVPDYGTYYDYHLEKSDYLVFSSVLYDVANGKAIWAAQSDTFVGSSQKKSLKSYVKAVIKKMEHLGLLAR